MTSLGVAGAGFSGAVVARQLAEAGHHVTVFDRRDHVAGNCHSERDDETGVMVHVYGPHIFHTRWDHVWDYVNRFGEFCEYEHRVKATVGGLVYTMPINLHTINQFFGRAMGPAEASAFIAAKAEPPPDIRTFEDQALAMVGRDLYEAFFAGYTRKQWGLDPSDLPASVLQRLPMRFTYDDRYFDHPHQGIPRSGYTDVVASILDHPSIDVVLSTELQGRFDHVVWTGPIDAYFDYRFGRLAYRTLDFERSTHDHDVQGCAVMNYCDASIPYTRVTEFRHFAPWESPAGSVTYRETSRAHQPGDVEYYPVRLARDQALLGSYLDAARAERGVTFLGRLGTYRYLDMDVTVKEALEAAEVIRRELAAERTPPVFTLAP